jgi:hypothetical protein
LAGETEVLGENLPQCRFVHHKPHTLCPEANPGRRWGKPATNPLSYCTAPAEPLIPDPRPFQVEIPIASLKRYKSPGSGQVPAELLQAGGERCPRSIHSLILFGIRKNCLSSGRRLLLYQFTRRAIKLTVIIIVGYHCYQLHSY